MRRTFLFLTIFILICFHGLQNAFAHPIPKIPLYLQESLSNNGKQLLISPNLEKFILFLESKSNLRFDRILVPWNRAKQLSLEGKGIIWAFSKTPDRLHQYQFSIPVFSSNIWAISYDDSALKLNSIADLKGKTVSVGYGVSHGLEFERAKNILFKVDEDTSIQSTRFKKLIAGRCDVLLWGLAQFEEKEDFENYLFNIYIPSLNDASLLNKKFNVSPARIFFDSIHFASKKGAFTKEIEKLNIAIRYGLKSGDISSYMFNIYQEKE